MPVVFVDLSQEQARLLNIALNKISGSFDQELLARLLSDLNNVPDIDITLSGFNDDELKKLLKSMEARDKREQLETFDMDEALEAARRAMRLDPVSTCQTSGSSGLMRSARRRAWRAPDQSHSSQRRSRASRSHDRPLSGSRTNALSSARRRDLAGREQVHRWTFEIGRLH